jgi:hypothetical protein
MFAKTIYNFPDHYLKHFNFIPIMKTDSTETNSILIMFALIAAFGLVTVVAVDIMLTAQEADARGCRPGSTGSNASQGRCVQ